MFIRSLDQKRAISERAKLIREKIRSILWSKTSNSDITLLPPEYGKPFITQHLLSSKFGSFRK